jgi:hypothetical protein
MANKAELSTKKHGRAMGKDPTWLVLFGPPPPLSKRSSHPPLVRGNVPYFRLVKGGSTKPLGVVTANSKP